MTTMPDKRRTFITLSARPVEAAGAGFSAGESYEDVGVALDEIGALTGNIEPVVLRVSALGGTEADRDSVAGDWLCVDHEPPRRIPSPVWNYSEEARLWTFDREWLEAWETCEDARWMLGAAGDCRVDRRCLAAAAAACAESSLPYVPRDVKAPKRAVSAVVRWASGAASEASVKSALADAYYAARSLDGKAQYAAYAAYYSYYDPALSAAHSAVVHGGSIDDVGRQDKRLAALSDVVRRKIGTVVVLRAASRRDRRVQHDQ